MKKGIVLITVCLFVFGSLGFAFAQERGTAKEAVDLVHKAMAYYKVNGKAKAFPAFNDKKGQFIKKTFTFLLLTGME